MTIIRADAGIITQINVFTVPAGGQQALLDHLVEAARACSAVDGWISANLHRSLDGTRVVNYAQARDRDAMARVFTLLETQGFLSRGAALGTAHPGLYDVVFTLHS